MFDQWNDNLVGYLMLQDITGNNVLATDYYYFLVNNPDINPIDLTFSLIEQYLND